MIRPSARSGQRAANGSATTLAIITTLALAAAIPARGGEPMDQETPDIGLFLAAGDERSAQARELEQGALLLLARLAGEASGGGGRPVVAARRGRWEEGAGELVRLVWSGGVQAVLGPADGRSAHLAEQVAARAKGRFVLLAPWIGDPALTRSRVPWLFRLAHDERRQAQALLEDLHRARKLRSVLSIVAVWDPDSRTGAEALQREARERGEPAPREVHLSQRALYADRAALEAHAPGVEAVVFFAPPAAAALAVRRLREEAVTAVFAGPLGLAAPEFLEAAGPAADGMVLAAPPEPGGPAAEDFREAYRAAHGRMPGTPAAYGHDGARVLLDALRSSRGVGGEALRQALASMRMEGLTGKIEFDASGGRAGPSPLARVERGRLLPQPGVSSGPDDPAQ